MSLGSRQEVFLVFSSDTRNNTELPDRTLSPLVTAEAIEEQVEIIPDPPPLPQPTNDELISEIDAKGDIPSWPVRIWRASCSAAAWLFGLASILVGLAFLAAVPIVQFLSLGYLLEASGRIVRTGRFRSGFVGFKPAARAGSLLLGTWLL